MAYSFTRYLEAKRTVDDRALNAHVWQSMLSLLAARQAPVTVVELGGGIGTMVDRLLDVPALPPLRYHLVDANAENIASARTRLARHTAHTVSIHGDTEKPQETPHHITLHTADLLSYLDDDRPSLLAQADVLIAHAVLDLLDLPTVLPQIARRLRPQTIVYFTINFDGATIFQPTIDREFDAQVERLYHRTMDERVIDDQPSGDSQSGRHLFHLMQRAGIQVLDAGASDWVVYPQAGHYPADEAYFLHFIVDTLHGALSGHPELDPTRFEAWIAQRHAQVELGELLYIAHQMDYLGIT